MRKTLRRHREDSRKQRRALQNGKKPGRSITHVHERIANRRLNFAHQTSRKLVDRFGTIVFEDLEIKKMQKN
ncbi:MAG: putative transposase, partial [Methanofollis sp.]|nr:putative transposase [Methanofollis sp.]